MKIGVPREIKDHEFRVSLTPHGARELIRAGHEVFVQKDAGSAIGFPDSMYWDAGAILVDTAEEAYSNELVLKVKEPQQQEYPLMKQGNMFFSYLHLASCPTLAGALIQGGVIAIGYETVTDRHGGLPLLAPMSQIAGRLAVQAASAGLTMPNGGSGLLLSGAIGVPPARIMVLGAGTVGGNAARLASRMGGDVTVFDINPDALAPLEDSGIKTCYSSSYTIETHLRETDVLIGATLIPGKNAPKLIFRNMVKTMKPGSVLVDVSIDQGGCSETSRPTTHTSPFYIDEGVVHYCVTNMPALVSRTATLALTHATLPYILRIANLGLDTALERDAGLMGGLQVRGGHITHSAVAEALRQEPESP
ncbi:MAG: alanine dehydrogenase [Burkholderiales bacterium]|nr:alanine dehydrogenase [Burkholderiales bacterium]